MKQIVTPWMRRRGSWWRGGGLSVCTQEIDRHFDFDDSKPWRLVFRSRRFDSALRVDIKDFFGCASTDYSDEFPLGVLGAWLERHREAVPRVLWVAMEQE